MAWSAWVTEGEGVAAADGGAVGPRGQQVGEGHGRRARWRSVGRGGGAQGGFSSGGGAGAKRELRAVLEWLDGLAGGQSRFS